MHPKIFTQNGNFKRHAKLSFQSAKVITAGKEFAMIKKTRIMAAHKDKREELLKFIDKHAFDIVIKAPVDKLSDKDREILEDIKRKTENEKAQFHEKFKTAEDVKKNFLSDVRSKSAVRLNKDLERLKLPTLPDIKDEFLELCKKLEV